MILIKVFQKIFSMKLNFLFFALLVVMMVGCGTQNGDLSADFDLNEVVEDANSQSNLNAVDVTNVTNESQNDALFGNEFSDTDVYHTENVTDCSNLTQEKYWLFTVEELGEVIVATGIFWDGWWNSAGKFSYQNRGSWDDNLADIYVPLLPSSGFGSLDDIRSYLMKYYSDTWLDSILSTEFSPFIEYNDMLFIHSARMSSARPNWETASHVLICQVDNLTIVESAVIYWDYETEGEFELTHSFTFIDGRIDSTSICPIWLEWL